MANSQYPNGEQIIFGITVSELNQIAERLAGRRLNDDELAYAIRKVHDNLDWTGVVEAVAEVVMATSSDVRQDMS